MRGFEVKEMQPVKKFRAGQVSCALWENEANMNGRIVTMLKATVERRYKDRDGNWKSNGSFGRNEIPLWRSSKGATKRWLSDVGHYELGGCWWEAVVGPNCDGPGHRVQPHTSDQRQRREGPRQRAVLVPAGWGEDQCAVVTSSRSHTQAANTSRQR